MRAGVKNFLHSSLILSGMVQARSDIALCLFRLLKISDYYTLDFVK
jgi:hypothetical protein